MIKTEAVYDYTDIAKRLKGEPTPDAPTEAMSERREGCAAIEAGWCDWPDCPCNTPQRRP